MKKHFSKSTVNTLWNTQESFCTQTRATPICFSAATRFFLFKARNKNAVYHTQWMKSKIPTMRTWMEPLPFYCKDLVFLNTAAESQPFGVNASMFRFTSRRTERCVLQIHRLLRFQNTNTFLFSFSPRCEFLFLRAASHVLRFCHCQLLRDFPKFGNKIRFQSHFRSAGKKQHATCKLHDKSEQTHIWCMNTVTGSGVLKSTWATTIHASIWN